MKIKSALLATALLIALPVRAQDAAPAAPGAAPAAPAAPVALIAMPPAPFHVENNWAKLPAGRQWGAVSAIDMDRDGKSVWVFERCGSVDDGCNKDKTINPIMKFDEKGNMVKSFGAGLFVYPHGIFVDRDNNIWVVDGTSKSKIAGDTIRKFNQDGKLLATWGTPGKTGNGPYSFSGVSDILQSPSGDYFVADGHDPDSNARVIKYNKNGQFVMQFGQRGTGAYDFNPPHALAMDKEGRLYVADRGNRMVKRYSQDGKLLDLWPQFGSPSGLFIDKNDILYVADSTSRAETSGFSPGIRMAKVEDGTVFANIAWPEQGTIEGVTVADDGTVYGGFTNIPGSHRFVKN